MKGYFLETGILYHLKTETHCSGMLHVKQILTDIDSLTAEMNQNFGITLDFSDAPWLYRCTLGFAWLLGF